MKNVLTKRVIIIFSILLTVVVTSLIVALATGNTKIPQLTNPDEVFYERIDDNGKVIYSITNQEIFEELKSNDGVDQLLYLIDSHLLQAYLENVTDAQIEDKIKELKYGTSDDDLIAELEADVKETYEAAFEQSMTLSGYTGSEDEYARIIVAKEVYARFAADSNGVITENKVASEYVKNYFEDIKAIKIRFTSAQDATAVMQKFNLVSLGTTEIREYLGFVYNSESLKDTQTEPKIVEAYVTVTPYYTDASGNLRNTNDVIVYTKGTTEVYTNANGDEFTKDVNGNLIDEDDEIIVKVEHIFTTLQLAIDYKTANTHYYTVSKVNAFDTNERAQVKDGDTVIYTIDNAGKIYNPENVDVTATTDLKVNKVYKSIKSMGTVTVNNSSALTNDEVLSAYVKMYNFVYGEYRTTIDEASTAEDLIALENDYLNHNFEDLSTTASSLAAYMFSTINLENETLKPYTVTARSYSIANDTYFFMVYKLTQPAKTDLYEIMLDYIEETIVLPAQTVGNLNLITSGLYNSTITWTSNKTELINSKGEVTLPTTVDTLVKLTYKITLDGTTRTGVKTVTVLVSGTTTVVTTTPTTPVSIRVIMNDPSAYTALYNKLLDKYIADTATDNVGALMADLRAEFGFAINDKFLGIDYKAIDAEFEYNTKGDKTVIATINGFPSYLSDETTEEAFDVTADELLTSSLNRNAALYTLYAAQFKEILYSDYFVQIFGDQRNLVRNNSDKMEEIYASIRSQKMSYLSYKQLYEQYGISFDYEDFASYARYQYGTKSEMDLLEYLVKGVLQPFLIDEAIKAEDLVALMVDTVSDNYDNYFSLDVTHLIIYLDFDENGSPDDFNDYIASLDETELDAFETLKATLETKVLEYLDSASNTFDTLITAFKNASREDATWGEYKQAGLWLMTEELNIADEEDETVKHSLQYSGAYGVKDSYVQPYVDALIALYGEYQLEQNANLSQLYSPLVETQFGVHIILASKGDDFDQFSAEFEEAIPGDPEYSVGSENASGKPTLAQMELYAQYYMYSLVYDLDDTEIESKYGITVPNLPNSVVEALEFYFGDLLTEMYVVGTLNIQLATRLNDGSFSTNSYVTFTDAVLKADLSVIRNTYYTALFSKYVIE